MSSFILSLSEIVDVLLLDLLVVCKLLLGLEVVEDEANDKCLNFLLTKFAFFIGFNFNFFAFDNKFCDEEDDTVANDF